MSNFDRYEPRKMRLDNALVARGLAPSRARARDAILRGRVTVEGTPTNKPSFNVSDGANVEIDDPALGYVSRGALKLVAGLEHFGYTPAGRVCLDVGASTGGFTEVLLRRGATRVYCVDSGHGQLNSRLTADPRVVDLEGTNVRSLDRNRIGETVSAITADVSFISLKLALPPALALASDDAWGVFLFKPQFEVGRSSVGKGGVVRDESVARDAVDAFMRWMETETGWTVDGTLGSPIAGSDGNREFLVGVRRG